MRPRGCCCCGKSVAPATETNNVETKSKAAHRGVENIRIEIFSQPAQSKKERFRRSAPPFYYYKFEP